MYNSNLLPTSHTAICSVHIYDVAGYLIMTSYSITQLWSTHISICLFIVRFQQKFWAFPVETILNHKSTSSLGRSSDPNVYGAMHWWADYL